jgi:hypothetical protein
VFTGLGESRRYQLWIGAVFAAACVVYLIVITVFDITSEAVVGHFNSGDEAFRGSLGTFEYPPLALLVLLFPRLFTADKFLYNVGFVAEMFIFLMIGLLVISKLAEKLGKDQKKVMLAYTILMLLMFEFVVDRYDVIPAVIALAAVYCFVTKRYTWAFVLLAIGTMVKLYPAVLFPIFMIPFIMEKDWKNALKGAAAFAAACFAVLIPVLILQPDMLSGFIGYHADRPLQIETFAASLIYPFSMLGLADVAFGFGFGSDNVLGSLPDAVAGLLTPLMVVGVLAVCGLYVYMLSKIKNCNNTDGLFFFSVAGVFALMAFIILGKVFSAQYLIWIIPPILFMFMTMDDEKQKRTMFILLAVTLIITQISFAYISGHIGIKSSLSMDAVAMFLVIIRNAFIIILIYFIARAAHDRFVACKVT